MSSDADKEADSSARSALRSKHQRTADHPMTNILLHLIEEQRRLSEQGSRAKSDFLANMSHELRTPLNAIIGFSELMLDSKVQTEEERHEYLRDILASGRHLQQLINDILDLSKVEAGKMEFSPEKIHVSEVIDELLLTLRVMAEDKRIEVSSEVASEVEEVVLDRTRLRQVLYNYVSNALKFTPEGGRVIVRVNPAGAKHFRLAVADTGIGIDPDDQKLLFTEFQQLDQTFAKEHQGTGLGLAVVKRIVEAQGGTVGVESEKGRGSVFIAVLPRNAGEPEEPWEGREPAKLDLDRRPPDGSRNGTAAVLVVEDEREHRTWLKETLRGAGYMVEGAASGAEAVAKARASWFEAVTLDMLLPDMGGLSVLRLIEAESRNPDVSVVAVTRVSDPELAGPISPDRWLVKPVLEEELVGALERAGVTPELP